MNTPLEQFFPEAGENEAHQPVPLRLQVFEGGADENSDGS
jgi:hypothetical protein